MALDTPHAAADFIRRVVERLDDQTARTIAPMMLAGAVDGLAAVDSAVLACEVAGAVDTLRERPRGRHVIRVRSTDLGGGQNGSPANPATVVEIANDDMPFLVDSVVAELQAQGLTARALMHPIFKARRDAEGRLEAIVGPGDRNWGDGLQESFIAILLPPLGAQRSDDLARALSAVLEDVRTVVTDWQAMKARVVAAVAALEAKPPRLPPGVLAEAVAFSRWLTDDEFTFLGLREHRLAGDVATGTLEPVAGSALGLLRDETARTLSRNRAPLGLSAEVRRHLASVDPVIVTKSNLISRVHRRVHMDYIGLKTYAEDGSIAGEIRIVGLFTSQVYTQPVRQMPIVRHKAQAVADALGYPAESHAGKAVANILETFPRDELFQIPADVLTRWVEAIMDLDVRPRLRLLVRRDRFERYVSALVYVPRDRFTTLNRERIGQTIAEAFNGRVSSFTPSFTEGPLVRVHYVIGRNEGGDPDVDVAALEARLAATIRSWEDQLTESLTPRDGGAAEAYARAFSPAYMGTFTPARALQDIDRIERLRTGGPVGIDFYRDDQLPANRIRAAVYRFDAPLPLSERVPVLENFGFVVIDERSDRIEPVLDGQRRQVALHDMVLATASSAPLDLERHRARMEEAFLAVARGDADSDGFNRLVILAGADWREAAMLRALAAYMLQIRLPFTSRYVADVLANHAGLARDLIELFRTRFDPRLASPSAEARGHALDAIRQRIEGALAGVPSLDEDRILRAMLGLIAAMVRTNFFTTSRDGGPGTIAFKFDPHAFEALPEPRPFREIFVYSPRVEGVHLRFEPIARGGIRWSDRAQDFRTEVLGLCKAQQVKNTVIVPSGAKGGFLPKRLPKAGSREDIQREGQAAYRIFISSLLDITDNIVDGHVTPPADVVRHEADDPYLVVAADKGTATFSDLANTIAGEHGFWLGDAFASGGSAGYDHKVMGITARGAWECVKRHFREMDIDIQTTPFRVAGVGDMSGDVFGNGMLLSRHIRLVAAFDHRDIFVDPDPDAATSFAERERLFRLARSSWQDYDRNTISAGGGVFSRQAKAIPLSDEMRRLLNLAKESVTPAELMRAILLLDVDLMWFGGIGTYVKAAGETDDQVGDRANDAVRITAAELRAKVIGEGANLGVTQRGRVEAAARGVRLNTDFIDNSAGVNSSDIEVNIKIALGPAVASGRLSLTDRNTLLASMTDDVAAACLVNNYQQSLAISLSERLGAAEIGDAQRLMQVLEARGLVDRRLEALPSAADLSARETAGQGLTRPELSVLLSWSKIAVSRDLLASSVPDDPGTADLLVEYFPPALRMAYADDIRNHRLRREIIATRITNSMINRGGPAFVVRLADETGHGTAEIAYAYLAIRAIFDLPTLWADIDALDGRIPGVLQLGLYGATRDLLIAETAELLRSAGRARLADAPARYRPAARALGDLIDHVLTPAQQQERAQVMAGYGRAGIPANLARRLAALPYLGAAPHATDLAERTSADFEHAIAALYAAEGFLRLDDLRRKSAAMALRDYYDRLAVRGALGALETASRTIAAAALAARRTVAEWLAAEAGRLQRAKAALDDIAGAGELTVSRLVVAAAQVRDLAA